MPIGIYKRTPEQIEQLKKVAFQKGHKVIEGFKKGNIPWNKNKKLSQKCGRNQKGDKNANWKNGQFADKDGYIFIWKPNHLFAYNGKYVPKHRLVVEKQIGRYLLPTEIAHHLGARNNNKLHMLMAFVNHSAHKRFHKNPLLVKPEEIIFDGRQVLY